jgi:hypothetical protein
VRFALKAPRRGPRFPGRADNVWTWDEGGAGAGGGDEPTEVVTPEEAFVVQRDDAQARLNSPARKGLIARAEVPDEVKRVQAWAGHVR